MKTEQTFDLVLTPRNHCILSTPGLWSYPVIARFRAPNWFAAKELADKSRLVAAYGWEFDDPKKAEPVMEAMAA